MSGDVLKHPLNRYVEKGGKEAIITSQDNITKCMLQPECCTRIVPD